MLINKGVLHRGVRHTPLLLGLLLLLPALAGCIGEPAVDWGSDEGEIQTSVNTGDFTASISSRTNPESDYWVVNQDVTLIGCRADDAATNTTDEGEDITSAAQNENWNTQQKVRVEGWLTNTKLFVDGGTITSSQSQASMASFLIRLDHYSDVEGLNPGDVNLNVMEWEDPMRVKALPSGQTQPKDFPHQGWAIVGIIPANENILNAANNLEAHQPIMLEGYLVVSTKENTSTLWASPAWTEDGCRIVSYWSPGAHTSQGQKKGWTGAMVVTDITYGSSSKQVDSKNSYIEGDIPIIGRGLYTTILLLSVVGAVALYIYSRNMIRMNANTQAQQMMSNVQLAAAKGASIEAERHDARMQAREQAQAAAAAGKQATGAAASVAVFDVEAALSSGSSDSGNYIAGGGVTVTDEATDMKEMIEEIQEGAEAEQQMSQKPRFSRGEQREVRSSVTTTSTLDDSQPDVVEVAEQPKRKRAVRKTRKTRKTSRLDEEEDELKPKKRTESKPKGPDLVDDDDFSDFSF
jgi:hypothetical protein